MTFSTSLPNQHPPQSRYRNRLHLLLHQHLHRTYSQLSTFLHLHRKRPSPRQRHRPPAQMLCRTSPMLMLGDQTTHGAIQSLPLKQLKNRRPSPQRKRQLSPFHQISPLGAEHHLQTGLHHLATASALRRQRPRLLKTRTLEVGAAPRLLLSRHQAQSQHSRNLLVEGLGAEVMICSPMSGSERRSVDNVEA